MSDAAAEASALRRRGGAELAAGAFERAVATFREALRLEPDNVRAHNNLGQALWRLGQREPAMASYRRALELEPRYAVGWTNLGNAFFEQGLYEEALAHYSSAIKHGQGLAAPHCNAGNALAKLGRRLEALAEYDRSLSLGAEAEAHFGRGNMLRELGRLPEALASYESAVALRPRYPEAWNNGALVLLELQQPEAALMRCERALAIQPLNSDALCNRGTALRLLHQDAAAMAAFEQAITSNPNQASALANLAWMLSRRGEFEQALIYFERSLSLTPQAVPVLEQYAAMLRQWRRLPEAIAMQRRLLAVAPDRPFARGALLGMQLAACDWSELDAARAQIEQGVAEGHAVCEPLTFLTLNSDPMLQRRCAERYAATVVPVHWRRTWTGPRWAHRKLRVAYLSADYSQHATAFLMAGIFECHDRERFRIFGASYGNNDRSAMRARLERGFDEFLDVSADTDEQIVEQLQRLEIDIAVDLKGYTTGMRPGIVARRAAPIQVSWLGYPGTQGLSQIDYIFADRVVVPPEQQVHYAEHVVYLPHSYYPTDDRMQSAAPTPKRVEMGLPERAFVFCCFNNNHKILPLIFDRWMRILLAVPDSVLWLLADNATAPTNLRREAANRGVNPARLVFAERAQPADHLARQRLADLFLDTLPYNAHTTATDALWEGLPVLTCTGQSFVGRVGTSVLNALGMTELITSSLSDYEARAIALGRDRQPLAALRERLRTQRMSAALFDTAALTRHVEAAYHAMWQRYCAGQAPAAFEVPPDCHPTVIV